MAITAAGAALTRRHRRTQATIATVTSRRLTALWRLLDPNDLDATSPGWVTASTDVVRGGYALSARAASAYYTAFRAVELALPPDPILPPATTLDVGAVRTSFIVTGPVSVKSGTGRGEPLDRTVANALVRVLGAGQRHAVAGSRDTLTAAPRLDRMARGWARVASGDGCAFCLMLASRGPVYTEESADFEAHDHCTCGVEPVLGDDYQWPDTSIAAREQWDALSVYGDGPGANLYNFRRAVEAARA